MTTPEHPIRHRNPALIVDLCFAATDPIAAPALRRAMADAGHQQAESTITHTIDELVVFGALRRIRHFDRRNSTVRYEVNLTDLGKAWLTTFDELPRIEHHEDGRRYRWAPPPVED